ncbi:glutathione S-transferase-like protein [Leptotrombidium deliense]|uniref:Glutathione S-transferase-like protein n=1 Tax=Leptotrombidium deliense TaxID=299467 RepID=A0A443Q8U9_9ACAR|nr:glutathione S-transferase-like protein [Leptotrombidium deliense]
MLPHQMCDVVNVDLIASKPEWLFAINKSGKVPVLELDGDKILTESTIIAEYFDEQYDGRRKLQPSDI